MSAYESGEVARQVANLLRVGKISALDEANARVKVSVAGLTTDWLPWSAQRAGNTRTWSPPRVGEQVMIASPYGDMGQAVVIASLFSDDKPAPAASKDKETTLYPDGAKTEHDSASHARTDTLNAAGSFRFTVGGSTIVMDTSKILLTSNGSTLEIDAAGIRLNGARVDLN